MYRNVNEYFTYSIHLVIVVRRVRHAYAHGRGWEITVRRALRVTIHGTHVYMEPVALKIEMVAVSTYALNRCQNV